MLKAENEKTTTVAAVVVLGSTSSVCDFNTTINLRAGTKLEKVLRMFVKRGALGLNCFEAVALCRDYVLRSTVSDLHDRNGIKFSRKFETVGEFDTRCVRYWLDNTECERVAAMLEPCLEVKHGS